MAEKLILNVVGQPRSGKDTVANHLRDTHGFARYTPSDAIRSYAAERDIPLDNRSDFSRTRHRMMAENPDFLVDAITSVPSELVCVSGLRVVHTLEQLREHEGASILALDCSSWTRYLRALSAEDSAGKTAGTYKDFLQAEFAEYRSGDPFGTATASTMDMADFRINTDVAEDLMLARVDETVEPLLRQFTEGR